MGDIVQVLAVGAVLAVPTGLLIWLGLAAQERGLKDRWAALLILGGTLLVGRAVLGAHDPEVSQADFVKGLILGPLLVCALPAAFYYALGRFVSSRAVIVAFWVASLAPLAFWLFFAWIGTIDLVYCPPDAYECPL